MPAGFYPVVYTFAEAYAPDPSGSPFRRPYITVRIEDPDTGNARDRLALVDSGADLPAIPVATAEALGIDLDQCEKQSSQGSGGEVDTYYTELAISACGLSQVCRVAIPVGLSFVLLGRDPFFRLIHFGLAEQLDPSDNRLYWRTP